MLWAQTLILLIFSGAIFVLFIMSLVDLIFSSTRDRLYVEFFANSCLIFLIGLVFYLAGTFDLIIPSLWK